MAMDNFFFSYCYLFQYLLRYIDSSLKHTTKNRSFKHARARTHTHTPLLSTECVRVACGVGCGVGVAVLGTDRDDTTAPSRPCRTCLTVNWATRTDTSFTRSSFICTETQNNTEKYWNPFYKLLIPWSASFLKLIAYNNKKLLWQHIRSLYYGDLFWMNRW